MKEYSLQYQLMGKISHGQDGAIWGDRLFRFNGDGSCRVFSLPDCRELAFFWLDRLEEWCPHSNAVFFGGQRWLPGDEFPLLYTNLYNTYAASANRREGTLCAYHLTREGEVFTAELVQIIRIGFVEDLARWKSLEGKGDFRPYGNFVWDNRQNRLIAFVMRDKEHVTRYLDFDMPDCRAGDLCTACGLRIVTLRESDVCGMYDGEYATLLQGACCRNGRLYSVEGATSSGENPAMPPRLQIMDTDRRAQLGAVDLYAAGLTNEPEFIDFWGDVLVYADHVGNVYRFTLEE